MIAYFIFLRFVAFLRWFVAFLRWFEAGYFRSDICWSGKLRATVGWARLESTEGLFNFWLGVARVHAKDFGSNHGWFELLASSWGRTASGELWTVVSISFLN